MPLTEPTKLVLKSYGTPGAIAGVAPTLDYRFALDRNEIDAVTLTDKLTVTRAATAAVNGPTGYLELAGPNVARFDHDLTTYQSLGLLVEAAGTNYRPKSTPAPSDIASISSRVSLSTTTQTTPANTQDALLHKSLVSLTGVTIESFQDYAFIPTTGKIVVSVFVKNISATKIQLMGDPSNQGYYGGIVSTIDFTVSPPTITKSTGPGSAPLIEVGLISLPNGWYRAYQVIDLDIASITPPNGRTRASVPVFFNPVVGQQFLSWGYQIEASLYPTSYIQTTNSTVSRTESATINGTGVITGTYTMVEKPAGCAVVNGTNIDLQIGYTAERVMVFPAALSGSQITAIRSAM